MQRLPLSDAISIDEVYLNMDDRCKYVLVVSHLRNRFLYATRDRTPLDGKERDEPKYVEYDDDYTI